MAKGIYVGIGGVKKGKKLFVGIGGAARKVKKVFVGAGGVKCVYSGDPAKVTTSIAPLSVERSALAATSVGNYALFAGGENYRSSFGTGLWNTVDAYNTSLEHSTPGHIFYTRRDFAATSIGNYAIFAGGVGENGAIGSVVAFNTALETSTSTLSRAKSSHAATNNNKYAIFVGGTAFTDVDAFNSSLERTKATAIKAPTTNLAAAKVGNYAVFAGGQEYTGSAVTPAVIAYNDSLGYTAFGSTSDNALSLKRINLEISKEERYLLCDEVQIKQVILNICRNAVDAMAETAAPTLDIKTGYNEERNEMFIRIKDNGKGMSSEDLEKVGTLFYTTKKSGTGLGLSICYEIIKQHNGRIDIQSNPGKGTSFTIILPCIKDDEFQEAMVSV